jgi:hypothetical protein
MGTYMKKKHAHCTPICAIPSSADAHANRLMSLQHPISSVLCGSVKTLAILAVPDTVPKSTNNGDRPREDRRDMIL